MTVWKSKTPLYPFIKKHLEPIQINSNKTKSLVIPTLIPHGDFLIQDEIEISPQITILPGLYRSDNNLAEILIHNSDSIPKTVNMCETLDAEINSFEITPIKTTKTTNTELLVDKLRLDNLYFEEKPKLLKVLNKFRDFFYQENETLYECYTSQDHN